MSSGEGKIYPAGEEGWVARWEDREQEFRKLIGESKKEIDDRYKSQLSKLSLDLSQKQAVLLKIRDIPWIGKYLITWAERGARTDYMDSFRKPLPEPTNKRMTGTRG